MRAHPHRLQPPTQGKVKGKISDSCVITDTELESARKALQSISSLCRNLNIPGKMRDIGAHEADLAKMVKPCVEANY